MKNLTIRGPVGPQAVNNKDDVATVLNLLRIRSREGCYSRLLGAMRLPEPSAKGLEEELSAGIKLLQAKVQGVIKPDGVVSPSGNTILFLGGLRSQGKQIIADLDEQVLYAYDGQTKVYEFDSASGDSDHTTAERPTLFQITRKEKIYRSKKYDAQMNYAMFFSSDGKAIHQSNAVAVTSFLKKWGVNYFGSHGCIRLAEPDAAKLFNWAPSGTPVFIDVSREAFQ